MKVSHFIIKDRRMNFYKNQPYKEKYSEIVSGFHPLIPLLFFGCWLKINFLEYANLSRVMEIEYFGN